VIVSDGGALPEVMNEAGMMFCLSKPDELRAALLECLGNHELREGLREKGLARAREFSWQATSELVWKHLHEI
jgi:glycosyltransferase involved in cell wall biosynthesis